MADNTNWGTVAIAAAAVYVAYLFFGKDNNSNGSGIFGSIFGGGSSTKETAIQKEVREYYNTLTETQKEQIIRGDAFDERTTRMFEDNKFTNSGNTGSLQITPPNFSLSNLTAEQITASKNITTVAMSSPLAQSALNVISTKPITHTLTSGSSSKSSSSWKPTLNLNSLPTSKSPQMVVSNVKSTLTSNPFQQSFAKSRGYLSTFS